MRNIRTVTGKELQSMIQQKADFLLIDVRERDELVNGTIGTARNIPLSELGKAVTLSAAAFEEKYGFRKPVKAKPIVVYCRTGHRSGDAAAFLASLGYNVADYPGAVKEWSKIDPNVKMY